MGVMASKYAGKCKQCRSAYGVGESIYWTRATGALCLACRPSETNVPARKDPGRRPSATGRDTDRFSSWNDFVECAVKSRHSNMQSTKGDFSFTKTYSWDEALKLARNGWDEVRPEVDALIEKIDSSVIPTLQPAFQSYFDVSGGMVDVGRFLDGEPECMVETRLIEIAKPGKVINILVNGSFSGSVGAKEIQKRGVAIIGLIDALEKLQHSTEVDLEISIREGLTTVVRLKNAADSLDIDMLMFAVAHPSTLRRLYFACLEGHPMEKYQRLSRIDYGKPNPLTMAKDLGSNVVLEGMINLDAEVWIREQLSEFGLVREEEA